MTQVKELSCESQEDLFPTIAYLFNPDNINGQFRDEQRLRSALRMLALVDTQFEVTLNRSSSYKQWSFEICGQLQASMSGVTVFE